MKLYTITRSLLKKRLQSKGLSEKEISLIIVAIFSYLHTYNYGLGTPFIPQNPTKLKDNDFMFLKLLYEDDTFLSLFITSYRDSQNPAIVASTVLTNNSRIIKDLINEDNSTKGIYDYTLNFDEYAMRNEIGLEEEFKIVDNQSLQEDSSPVSGYSPRYKEDEILSRTDNKRSYTDSVMARTPRIDRESIPNSDYNKIGPKEEEVEITLINKPNVSVVPVINGELSPNPRNSEKKSNSTTARDSIIGASKYPVLNFLLSRSN